jgi:YrbI family 3-deoxy-D-manno-octulosonate 8-phosphate phosphatase
MISPQRAFCVQGPDDLARARWQATRLAEPRPCLPKQIDAVIFDFDGVFTANTVYVDQDGVETVRASRGDGMGIGLLKAAGIACSVLSKEPNPVVLRRCEKLKIPCMHGVDDKLPILRTWASERGYPLQNLVYVGNDINDLECLEAVGCGVAVADSVPSVLAVADYVLTYPGGQGAVREVCDWVLAATRELSRL